jgi:hypothetical protein
MQEYREERGAQIIGEGRVAVGVWARWNLHWPWSCIIGS